MVTTDLGGLPELVDPGTDGEVVAPDDPEALACSLKGLLADPERALELGRAARRKAERRFAPERHLGDLEAFYRSVA